jgi:adenylate cyclase
MPEQMPVTRRTRALHSVRQLAREIDSQPELLRLASRMRSHLPGDDRYGDTLSLAGRKPHQLVAQGLTAIQPKRASVVGELGLAALQLWQAASEAQGRGRGDRQLALLFTDLARFSLCQLQFGGAAPIELLRTVADESETAVRDHHGRMVKNLGDGWMAVFDDATSAVEAALSLQERLDGIELDGYRPRLHAGVHCGRPRRVGGDYLGVDVNIAARVAGAARPGQLLVSEAATAALDPRRVTLGRARRLRAPGAPRKLRVVSVSARDEPAHNLSA